MASYFSVNNIRLVLAVIGVSCICVWIAMAVSYFQDQRITLNQQRPGNEQLDAESEHPAPRQDVSGDPNPSSQWLKSPKDPLSHTPGCGHFIWLLWKSHGTRHAIQLQIQQLIPLEVGIKQTPRLSHEHWCHDLFQYQEQNYSLSYYLRF